MQVSQGDRIKGGSVRRSRVAEVLAQTLNMALVPARHGEAVNGVTFEVSGKKAEDTAGKPPQNTLLSEEAWRGLLGDLRADGAWETATTPSKTDHMAVHSCAARCCKFGCLACCLVFLADCVRDTRRGESHMMWQEEIHE